MVGVGGRQEGVIDMPTPKASIIPWLRCSGNVSPRGYCDRGGLNHCCVAHAGEKGGRVKDNIGLSRVAAGALY